MMASTSSFSGPSPERALALDGGTATKAVIRLPSEAAQIAALLAFAEDFAHRHHLAVGDRAWLLIILEELFLNAVDHGYCGRTDGAIAVALRHLAGQTVIHFSDDAPPFDPLAWEVGDLDLPVSERPIGGLGLHLLRSGVDSARYRRIGGRNHLVLARRLHH